MLKTLLRGKQLAMSNDKFAKLKVDFLFSQYKLSKINLDNLIYIIEDQGFEIIEFEVGEKSPSYSLLKDLNLTQYAQAGKAFAYQQGSAKFVFICEDMSAKEKLYALAHEVGHIFCLHLRDGNMEYSVQEEFEANEFAHHLLHPSFADNIKRWIKGHKKGVVIGASTTLVIVTLVFIIAGIIKSNSYYGDYYITETGEKYHREDCIFIKDKKNVERLTDKEYYSGEYDPCQICLPND